MKAPKPISRFLLLLLLAVLPARIAFAHPMGNFSVNHYTKIALAPSGINLHYYIDLAEIPTFQEQQQFNLVPTDPASVAGFLEQRSRELARGLHLQLAGNPVPLSLVSKGIIFPAGAGGLPTMKMGFVFHASYPPTTAPTTALAYTDENYPGHAGWKEIVITGAASLLLASSVPAIDRSAELTNYPTDMLNSPPQALSATANVALAALAPPLHMASTPAAHLQGLPASPPSRAVSTGARLSTSPAAQSAGTPAQHPANAHVARATEPPAPTLPSQVTAHTVLQANRQGTAHNAFTELVRTQHLSLWFLLTAACISVGLGALHALEPGHGKTIVAAYLVGSRGTARHALWLGIIVTVAHTASVFAMGAITLYASRYILPEKLYPWLGLLSGLTIAALGAYMLLRRWSGKEMDHAHAAGEMHGHWFSQRTTDAAPAPTPATQPVSLTQLFTLGITGGIIPCPAALVVLLSAFALHRIGFGFFLITAFSTGLAAVLVGFGLLMVYARRFMGRLAIDGPLTKRWLPVASAAFMTLLGTVIAERGFAATGISVHTFSQQSLGPALYVAGLGLILGIRHSTDPDHVVAISTIVTRQSSIRGAAVIGTLWGLGHTLTIFAVGCLIILGGVVIPTRIGLSMEFSVGLMLILLGMLNLTGMMQKITTRLRPKESSISKHQPASALASASLELETSDRPAYRRGIYQTLRPLAIGLVHGLAGSAAVALLVLSTIHNPLWAIGYLLIFGAGTMLGMMCMTMAMSLPLVYAGGRVPQLGRCLGIASGLVSVCFGSFLVYQLGYLNGLFTNHPHWTPQ